MFHLERGGVEGHADAHVVHGQLQEEGAEGGGGGGGRHLRELVHHLPGGRQHLVVQRHALLRPVLVGVLVVQPHQHR